MLSLLLLLPRVLSANIWSDLRTDLNSIRTKLSQNNITLKTWDITKNDGTNDSPIQSNIQGNLLCLATKTAGGFTYFQWQECDADTNNKNFYNFQKVQNTDFIQIQRTNKWGKVKCISYDDEGLVTLQSCDSDDYYNEFYYNEINGRLELAFDDDEKTYKDISQSCSIFNVRVRGIEIAL